MEKIEYEIDSLPKDKPCFLLSFASMDINKQVAQYLKENRPLCILVAAKQFDDVEEFTALSNEMKYNLRVDNNIMIHNTSPEQFIDTYEQICTMRFCRILTDTDYSNLPKMMSKDGRVVKL